jgi:hypothetical protein
LEIEMRDMDGAVPDETKGGVGDGGQVHGGASDKTKLRGPLT